MKIKCHIAYMFQWFYALFCHWIISNNISFNSWWSVLLKNVVKRSYWIKIQFRYSKKTRKTEFRSKNQLKQHVWRHQNLFKNHEPKILEWHLWWVLASISDTLRHLETNSLTCEKHFSHFRNFSDSKRLFFYHEGYIKWSKVLGL